MAFAILRLAFEKNGRASGRSGMEHGRGREHVAGKISVALQGEQKIHCSGSVTCGAEDFVLIFL
jgi:hypothetical protein